ncbi:MULTISPECIES: transporter substrate-binding domain-containing protein [unclassified Pseudomonas]|uniref:substrate-binding periplasmic protein n=1 Tax=unclassified Pseudomonas TaxID=196821 RepID=UPI00244D6797|nr:MULTISPECIES: transporter substrate-binding domain-containing protein [unclassified Pseudomonas]MDG9924624.1 transporter substrate-binding domain-containing protein [Pseudomonas sp. GD04045]MDH0033503.1 transporter substrate-binding domain-containing protein [Pseudomonas sp. GD04019]
MKSALLLILILLLSSTATAEDSPCRLKVGWEEWFPLIHQHDGQLTGSEYQLLLQLANGAGCSLEFIEVPWARALQLLKRGQLDMLYGASRTAEREAYAQFSQTYRLEQMVLVVRVPEGSQQQDTGELSLVAWLAEHRPGGQPHMLGLIRGFYYGDALEPIVRDPATREQRLEVRWDQQLHQMLILGRIDGYLVEASVARAQQAVGGQPMRVFNVSEHPEEPMHLMFSREVPRAVVERFDNAIRLQREAPAVLH